jgi:hypothetical protein
MAQVSRVPCFLIEALEHLFITREAFGQGFDCDIAADSSIASAVDDTHASTTQDIEDVVLSYPDWYRLGALLAHISPDRFNEHPEFA